MAKNIYSEEIVQGGILKELNKIFSQQAEFYTIRDGIIYFGRTVVPYVKKFGVLKTDPNMLSKYSNLLISSIEARGFFAHFRKTKTSAEWNELSKMMVLYDEDHRLELPYLDDERFHAKFCTTEYQCTIPNLEEYFPKIISEVSNRKYSHLLISPEDMKQLDAKEACSLYIDEETGESIVVLLSGSLFGGMKRIKGIDCWRDKKLTDKYYKNHGISIIIFRQIYDDIDIYTITAVT